MAAASCSGVGSSSPLQGQGTRCRLTSEGVTSSFSLATQCAMSFDTVARGSTFSTSAYRAPTASVRLTHSVRPPAWATQGERYCQSTPSFQGTLQAASPHT